MRTFILKAAFLTVATVSLITPAVADLQPVRAALFVNSESQDCRNCNDICKTLEHGRQGYADSCSKNVCAKQPYCNKNFTRRIAPDFSKFDCYKCYENCRNDSCTRDCDANRCAPTE